MCRLSRTSLLRFADIVAHRKPYRVPNIVADAVTNHVPNIVAHFEPNTVPDPVTDSAITNREPEEKIKKVS
jgi:hypothetical protein